ncbi:hypothetical protein DYB26_013099, partial [Aphanomyces astaci]
MVRWNPNRVWNQPVFPLDDRATHPVQCLFCGDLERLHHFKDCPDIDQDGIDRIKWVWGWRMCGYLRNPKFQKYAKKTAQMRKKMGKKFYRIYMPDDAVNMATLTGVLEVPFCADSGSDANIISEEMLEALKTKTEVDVVQLAKTWKGYAVDEQPVYADVAANLRIRLSTAAGPVNLPGVQLCYVISRSDSLLVSRYALQSIGIDMNHLLEQVAQHQSHEDGDDVGEPDEDEDFAFGVATRRLQGGEQDLDKLDEDAAVSLLEKAFETLKITDAGKHVKTHKLKDIVMQASAKGVWRAQFRGTDEAANVPAMDIKLKADAQPHRSKARK